MSRLFEQHKATLEAALAAAASRAYWSAYPEVPSGKSYGETAKDEGAAAFKAMLGQRFALDQPGSGAWAGAEESPYGFPLGITYPQATVAQLVAAAEAAQAAWASASIEARVGACLEILHRLNRRSFEIANAVMHTTGQGFAMAFQAGGPHAQDRGLEATAYAYAEMKRVPARARWEKPQGKGDPLRLDKDFAILPRGVALVIGVSTFPTWNGYPGLFASLATGNAVIVKPHPGAVLPLALTVRVAREVLKEQGFDPNLVLLAADVPAAPLTKELVTHPAIGIVDYTGGPAFAGWLAENARGKQLYVEGAGINTVVIDGTADFKGMCQNLAFSLSLYSGQMCTAPQNLFVPRQGIETDEGRKSFDDVARAIAGAVEKLLADPERAAGILGAVQSPATLARVAEAAKLPGVLLAPRPAPVAGFERARTSTPVVVAADARDAALFEREWFGPIAFVVATDSTAQSLALAAGCARRMGAITAAAYATDPAVLAAAETAFRAAGVPLSENLTGGIYVNQSAAFSDFHVTGANPAGNACLTDTAFVAGRFRVVAVRRPAA
ncbi:MAG: phenylacetic acid degradation protein PaaN [Alphaproteobacteria bacterium]|nr:phenylacetic acid degradation protein PaaN [Alphaproteobacteria bacterium]